MTKTVNTLIKQKSGLKVLKSQSDEYYGDYPWFKENVLKWNKAQELMGIKETLIILRIEMGYKGFLIEMNEQQWENLLTRLRKRYKQMVEWGKIDAKV
tara:strand:+ start:117 stop:410 length:294 start_codon:yes stop_codon:yes gene_type:complete